MKTAILTLIALLVVPLLTAANPPVEQARKLYNSTEYEESLKVLSTLPKNDAEVQELVGRNYYMLGEYKKASEALEKSVAAEPRHSDHALWLARAYGRRAETSSPFTAPGLASKARQYFEKAVELDPRNLDALNDLMEYYMEAPGFLGGGYAKAVATADKIAQVDRVEGTWAKAKLAEKKREYSSAEEYLRRAAQMAPQQVSRIIDLARFLSRQGRYDEAEQNFERAAKVAPNEPKLLYERAESYIQAKRNLDVARQLLERYLKAPLTVDDPPRSAAEKLLRQAQGG